jgi:hypothetical protein
MDNDPIDNEFLNFFPFRIDSDSRYNVNIDLLEMIREYAKHHINIGKYNHYDELLKNITDEQLATLKETGQVIDGKYIIKLSSRGFLQILAYGHTYEISFMKYPTSQIRKNIISLTPSERRSIRGLSKTESNRQHRIVTASTKRGKNKSRRGDREDEDEDELPDFASLSLSRRRVELPQAEDAQEEAQAQSEDVDMDFDTSFASLSLGNSGRGRKSKKSHKKTKKTKKTNKKTNKKSKKTNRKSKKISRNYKKK